MDTGKFVKGFSHFCEPGAKRPARRRRVGLAELGDLLKADKCRDGASRKADYALSLLPTSNGCGFQENDMDTRGFR